MAQKASNPAAGNPHGPIRAGLEEALDQIPAPDLAHVALARQVASALDVDMSASMVHEYAALLATIGIGDGIDDDTDPFAGFSSGALGHTQA